jgi:hypothetical protein
MGNKKRSLIGRLVPFVIIFAAGTGFGYYVSDQRQDERIQEALEQAGSDLVERGRELSESARDSARAALRRLAGDST